MGVHVLAGRPSRHEGTEYWQFCFGLPVDPADRKQKLDVHQGAYAHIMGRATYEAMAGALPTADHPFTPIMNAARKVVFSRALRTAEWANTTIAAGDTTEEIDKLRRGGDGHIVVWGGVGFWRSLMRLDLIDEIRLDLHPAGNVRLAVGPAVWVSSSARARSILWRAAAVGDRRHRWSPPRHRCERGVLRGRR